VPTTSVRPSHFVLTVTVPLGAAEWRFRRPPCRRARPWLWSLPMVSVPFAAWVT
jgi:hypothetical protein